MERKVVIKPREFVGGAPMETRKGVRTSHYVRNTGAEMVRLVVVGGITLVGLLSEWPTRSPYEIFEGENPR